MLKMRKMLTKNQKGFTLVELIVVIAILGILAAIAIPRFAGVRANANESVVIANLKNMQTAAETVAAEQNIAITAVTTEQAVAALGTTLSGPGTTSYAMVSGDATATLDGSVPYPAGGVLAYSGIN